MSQDSSNTLYVIVPYFNFVNYKSGIRNLEIFINNLSIHKNAKMVLVEGHYGEERLPDYSDRIYKHIKLPLKNVLWVKENLINIGFSHLPEDWKYGAWIDRDILFCNPNWVQESIDKLQECDIIQPWKECVFLDAYNHVDVSSVVEKGGVSFLNYSLGYVLSSPLRNEEKTFGHPGQSWAITRAFYEKIGGLYEHCIVGGGDGVISHAIKQTNLTDLILKYEWTFNYRYGGPEIVKFYRNFAHVKCSFIPGTIIHYYHGAASNKSYNSRYQILQKYDFSARRDLYKDENGIICFKQLDTLLEKEIKYYFLSRNEDE
jgi:hypothetical protein